MNSDGSRLIRLFAFGAMAFLVLVTLTPLLGDYSRTFSPIAPASASETTEHSTEAGGDAGHADPFATILLELTILILAAVIGRWAGGLLNLPSVLGELLIGVVIGNVLYALNAPFAVIIMHLSEAGELFQTVWQSGVSAADAANQVFSSEQLAPGAIGHRILGILSGHDGPRLITMAIALWIFSNLGVTLLLFLVGLESSVEEMLGVGPQALMVAIIGVVAPFALGFGASMALIPDAPLTVSLFLGATLAATSVGITARVFKDLDRLQTKEAKLILGAAVIDDILGLIVLAVVIGIVTTGAFQVGQLVKISASSAIFLGIVVFVGSRFMPSLIAFFGRMEQRNLSLLFSLVLAFFVAWAANMIGLATIVGAFAAGLILNEEHLASQPEPQPSPLKILEPLESLFAPIFFVLMGMQVNLASFLQPGTLAIAGALIVAAIVGKVVSGFVAGKGVDKVSVGIGMVPRGEVGLIFASIGKGLGVITGALFSAVVIMVIMTTLITPLALKWSLFRGPRKSEAA